MQTVYAALRALHTKEALQRKKHMDFLGMRLVDMMVQTLPQICLQVFLGISTDALAPGAPLAPSGPPHARPGGDSWSKVCPWPAGDPFGPDGSTAASQGGLTLTSSCLCR